MVAHGGVEIVVLKFSGIIRRGFDIITEYVNKKHLLHWNVCPYKLKHS